MRVGLAMAMSALCGGVAANAAEPAMAPVDRANVHRRADDVILPRRLRLLPELKVRMDMRGPVVHALLDDPDSGLRRRFASSMFEFYPRGGSGFHLSGGMRFFDVTSFSREAERASNGLLYTPRSGVRGMLRTGFKRYTPAATFGYTTAIDHMVLGVEGGALLGTANPDMPREFDRARRDDGRASRVNPIANLVLGYKF